MDGSSLGKPKVLERSQGHGWSNRNSAGLKQVSPVTLKGCRIDHLRAVAQIVEDQQDFIAKFMPVDGNRRILIFQPGEIAIAKGRVFFADADHAVDGMVERSWISHL